jgi:5-methylcytosine-specific restriction endonuclease McrA
VNTTGQISGTATTTSSGAKVELKTCSKCKIEKPLTEFHKDRSTKDGHMCACKLCDKARKKAYYEANREKIKAHKKAYYEANREKISARKKVYREANPEKIKASQKAWYEANREKVKAHEKAYREANREKISARKKAWYEANREKIKAHEKAYREANREKIKAYYEANREKVKAKNKAYRQTPRGRFFRYRSSAKRRGIEFLLTEEQVFELIKKPCTYCGKPKSSGIDRIDSNGVYTIENCVPCCWNCNTRKGTKSKEVFLQEIKEGKWDQ